jgi:hypothetical protein
MHPVQQTRHKLLQRHLLRIDIINQVIIAAFLVICRLLSNSHHQLTKQFRRIITFHQLPINQLTEPLCDKWFEVCEIEVRNR